MRFATLGLLTVLVSAPLGATAADLDYGYLRGSDDGYAAAPVIDWSGVYVGGHGGYSSASQGFGKVFQPIVANALRYSISEEHLNASSLLATRSTHTGGESYGAYVGYNVQFDEVVVGLEGDYTYFGRTGFSSDTIRRFSDQAGEFYAAVGLNGVASTKIQDYGTIRGRAGYAFGSFLPYVTGGVAVGRATIRDSVDIQSFGFNKTNPTVNYGYAYFNPGDPMNGIPGTTTYGGTKKVTVGGVALGAGLEYAITPNILLRGEYQYVLFNDFKGHSAELNTVRGGAAFKF
ncbi:outer membrane protein [Methylobacterium sp. Leaf118]|uniref:outer membrane protein n=1 Tax=Methylobacterium sp. Leaf118 TaxID=2876562 RepID=UPI001E2A3941|nr:outer membrane beta-barrel protein [Methylobacterium sp. Leaf118]